MFASKGIQNSRRRTNRFHHEDTMRSLVSTGQYVLIGKVTETKLSAKQPIR
ncbi:hypothetical protein J6590_040715 [Homalodisca vitripennis]|nr:hypothetical protein J6590_040715 [Homalodisca vitripennis]